MHTPNPPKTSNSAQADSRGKPAPRWIADGRDLLRPDGRCSVMAILNITPDSFSDGGTAFDRGEAIARAGQAMADGADILDIGGESTRPGAITVPLEEEWARVSPVIAGCLQKFPQAIVSVDTYKPEVARRAIDLGAMIVNDITGLGPDSAMAGVVAESQAALVLMHMQGTPATMQAEPRYEDVVGEIYAFFEERMERAARSGIARERIALDPGIGFGKTLRHNLTILQNLERFADFGCAVLIGTSRKRMIGEITGRPVHDRAAGSVASALFAANRGAHVVRVHDTAATVDALKVWHALEMADVGGN